MTIRPVPLLTVAVAIVGANSLILPPIAAVVAADLGAEPAQVVRAMSFFGAGIVGSALLLAPRSDRIGGDRALAQACMILLLALIGCAVAPNVVWLQLAHIIAGIGAGMALPAIYGLAAQVAPEGREKQSIGYVLSGWTISLVLGIVLASAIADLAGWRSVYAGLAALTVLTLIALRFCDMALSPIGRSTTSPLSALRVPGVLRALVSVAMLMLGFFSTYGFMGVHVITTLGQSVFASGAVIMSYGLGYGAAALLNRFVDPWTPKAAFTLGFGGLFLSYVMLGLSHQTYGLMLMMGFPWGMFQHFGLNAMVARLNGLSASQRGAVMGLNSAVTYLTVTLGAYALRWPYDHGGIAACIAISAACALIGLIETRTAPNRPDNRPDTASG